MDTFCCNVYGYTLKPNIKIWLFLLFFSLMTIETIKIISSFNLLLFISFGAKFHNIKMVVKNQRWSLVLGEWQRLNKVKYD
jgi:hypothetical protein